MMKNLFKYASLLLAAAMLFACDGNIDTEDPNGDGAENPLKVTADKSIIQTFGGDFATITVTLDGEPVTEEVTFYDENFQIMELTDFKFSTATPGEYKIIAAYGTYTTKDNPLNIMAVSVDIPETPADPEPERTDFKTRVLIVEHTGTECGFCPPMKTLIHKSMEDEAFADRIVLTNCHTFNSNDPAYFNENQFKEFNGVDGHPYLLLDSYKAFNDYNQTPAFFKNMVGELYDAKNDVSAGIAVNSVLSEDQAIIKVGVKAAETASYRVGAYLLEDGIKGNQTSATADWMHIHDGVISHVDAKYYAASGSARYYGHSLGEIAKGKSGEYLFIWNLDDIQAERQTGCSRKAFVKENLRIAVFVTTVGADEKGNEFYYVNNVIEAPINGSTPYEYR